MGMTLEKQETIVDTEEGIGTDVSS
jgi:hypothetical protein